MVRESSSPTNRQGQVTLRAVAAHAGVSKSLVSRVLQGSPHVSPERREAVEQAIRELGYRPNGAARSLTQRRTMAVGVLMNDLRQPWFVDFLQGLNTRLHRSEMHAFVGDARLDRAGGERVLRAFLEMRVDGLVLAGSMPVSSMIMEAASRLPTVVAGSRDFDLAGVDVIAQDDAGGVADALKHLADLGHERIAHLAGVGGRAFEIRRTAYEDWMREHGRGRHRRVVECDITEEGGYQAGRELFSGPGVPTAVVAVNDLSCVGALSAAREAALRVPEDVSLVGFDNSGLARMRHLELTSVDVAAPVVGRLAGEYLLDRIAEPERPARTALVPTSLVVRSSTTHPSSR